MKLTHIGILNLLAAGLFWLIETAYFGWNWKPSCNTELLLDTTSQIWMVIGIFIIYLDYQPRRNFFGIYTNDYCYDRFIKHQINVFGIWITYKTKMLY
jgi:hypothetical protein